MAKAKSSKSKSADKSMKSGKKKESSNSPSSSAANKSASSASENTGKTEKLSSEKIILAKQKSTLPAVWMAVVSFLVIGLYSLYLLYSIISAIVYSTAHSSFSIAVGIVILIWAALIFFIGLVPMRIIFEYFRNEQRK